MLCMIPARSEHMARDWLPVLRDQHRVLFIFDAVDETDAHSWEHSLFMQCDLHQWKRVKIVRPVVPFGGGWCCP